MEGTASRVPRFWGSGRCPQLQCRRPMLTEGLLWPHRASDGEQALHFPRIPASHVQKGQGVASKALSAEPRGRWREEQAWQKAHARHCQQGGPSVHSRATRESRRAKTSPRLREGETAPFAVTALGTAWSEQARRPSPGASPSPSS